MKKKSFNKKRERVEGVKEKMRKERKTHKMVVLKIKYRICIW